MPQSMGSQRFGHDLVTEQPQQNQIPSVPHARRRKRKKQKKKKNIHQNLTFRKTWGEGKAIEREVTEVLEERALGVSRVEVKGLGQVVMSLFLSGPHSA